MGLIKKGTNLNFPPKVFSPLLQKPLISKRCFVSNLTWHTFLNWKSFKILCFNDIIWEMKNFKRIYNESWFLALLWVGLLLVILKLVEFSATTSYTATLMQTRKSQIQEQPWNLNSACWKKLHKLIFNSWNSGGH